MIISSVLLECLHGASAFGIEPSVWVAIHIIVGLLWSANVLYHLYLHWGSISQWPKKFRSLKSKLTMCLTWLMVAILVTGIISTITIVMGLGHTPIGGIHGKIGLLAMTLAIFHLLKRWKWFKNRNNGTAFRPVVDTTKCVSCGLCVKRCVAQVFEKQGNRVVASHTDYCLQCKKCIAHCPKKAIS